jgi:hypothetical protein
MGMESQVHQLVEWRALGLSVSRLTLQRVVQALTLLLCWLTVLSFLLDLVNIDEPLLLRVRISVVLHGTSPLLASDLLETVQLESQVTLYSHELRDNKQAGCCIVGLIEGRSHLEQASDEGKNPSVVRVSLYRSEKEGKEVVKLGRLGEVDSQ